MRHFIVFLLAALAQELRTQELYKTPGVSETIDWVSALVALGHDRVDALRLPLGEPPEAVAVEQGRSAVAEGGLHHPLLMR